MTIRQSKFNMIPQLIIQIKDAYTYRNLPLLYTISEGILEFIGEASEYRRKHSNLEPAQIENELSILSNLYSQVLHLIFKLESNPTLKYCRNCGKWKPQKSFMTSEGLICTNCQLKRIRKVIYHKIK